MSMKARDDARGMTANEAAAGAALLAEFGVWLDRERGLSPTSVRCYCVQAKAFLTGVGGPERSADWTRARSSRSWSSTFGTATRWSAKAMVTSLRAFLRFVHATGRAAVPLMGAVPAVAVWRLSVLPRGFQAAET
jgi:integrase/recombinase XerD